MGVLATHPSRRQVLTLAAALCLGSVAAEEDDSAISEYAVKAALLFKFLRFLEWPEAAMPKEGAPFRIGILGKDPFGNLLDKTVSGKSVGDHPITIVRSREIEDVEACPVVFICNSEKDRLEDILAVARKSRSLTVADTDGLAEKGVMINLVLRENKVKFQINYAAAHEAEIEVDAQLLKLAELVGPSEDKKEAARG